eukprot:Skav214607  [mRNA]  locus=scaffold57:991377:991993:- [translate_table: standard]
MLTRRRRASFAGDPGDLRGEAPPWRQTLPRRGRTPLHRAAEYGQAAAVARLLELRAAVAPRDADGDTPLHDAVRNGHKEVVQLLVAVQAPLDLKNNRGRGPRKV